MGPRDHGGVEGPPFYNSAEYCRCLGDFGTAVPLGPGLGCLLGREIPGAGPRDLIHPYPLFTVDDGPVLMEGLRGLRGKGFVTATIVTDPLGADPLPKGPWDHSVRWKKHLLVDCSMPGACAFPSKVRYYSRRSSSAFGYSVEMVRDGKPALLGEWLRLWGVLVGRHSLSGLKALSESYFRRLFELPEPVLAVLRADDGIHAIHIWITRDGCAWSHLHASDELAYESGANYLLYAEELMMLTGSGFGRCLLGSSAGAGSADGLFRFKAQFANATCENALLGLIIEPGDHEALTGSKGHPGGYFPAYRSGELA